MRWQIDAERARRAESLGTYYYYRLPYAAHAHNSAESAVTYVTCPWCDVIQVRCVVILSMAETSLHPRPDFSTLLQSDANGRRDGLSYYDYQRALRYKRVAILQQKKANSYIPGYKKRPATGPTLSRQVFQNANAAPTPIPMSKSRPTSACHSVRIDPVPIEIDSKIPAQISSDSKMNQDLIPTVDCVCAVSSPSRPTMECFDSGKAGVIGLPIVSCKQRLIKSATARTYNKKAEDNRKVVTQRPNTVSGARDLEPQTSAEGKLTAFFIAMWLFRS